MSLTQQAHAIICQHFDEVSSPKSLAVDATCGNGHDTLFLCQLGFKKVVGFDVQQDAIEATQKRLGENNYSAQLILAGHETLSENINEPINCITFNLGYLPGTDKSLTTATDSTLACLNQAVELLAPNGLISLLCYPGHTEGKHETESVRKWLAKLPEYWKVETYQSTRVNDRSPILFVLTQ